VACEVVLFLAGCLAAQTFVSKPGSSGSLRSFIGAIADNGTAVPEAILNVHFQNK